MLPAAHRLRRRVEFAATVRAGRRSARGPIVVHLAFQPTSDADATRVDGLHPPARVGFVIPRTVGCAVVRNRIRRRLRHLAAERVAVFPPGANCVIRVLPGAAALSFAALAERLDAAILAASKPRVPARKAGA